MAGHPGPVGKPGEPALDDRHFFRRFHSEISLVRPGRAPTKGLCVSRHPTESQGLAVVNAAQSGVAEDAVAPLRGAPRAALIDDCSAGLEAEDECLSASTPAGALMDAQRLESIADALLASYDLDDRRNRVALPAREAIVAVVEQARRILFPGFYADEPLPAASRRFRVGTWLCQLHADLARIIDRALAHHAPDEPREGLRGRARLISAELVASLPKLRGQLRLDAQAALEGDPAAGSIEEVILTYPGFEAITVHRIAHSLYTAGVPHVPRAMSEFAHQRTGIDIHPGAQIGQRFFIDHGTGVVIGETTHIGDDVKIYQGVTLGALSVKRSLAGAKRHPTLADGVVIYAGATVLGGETVIGQDAVIGGNVWITSSVAPATTVLESRPRLDIRTPRKARPAE